MNETKDSFQEECKELSEKYAQKAHHITDEPIDDNFDLFKEKTANPLDLAKEYFFWHEKIEEVKKKLKLSEGKLKILEENLYKAMIESGLEEVKIFGKKIAPSFQYWASVPEEKAEHGFPQLRELDLGPLIKNTVNSTTFSAQIRILIKEGRCVKNEESGEWLVDGKPVAFNITEKKIIKITKG